jgi:hypothetical protein
VVVDNAVVWQPANKVSALKSTHRYKNIWETFHPPPHSYAYDNYKPQDHYIILNTQEFHRPFHILCQLSDSQE